MQQTFIASKRLTAGGKKKKKKIEKQKLHFCARVMGSGGLVRAPPASRGVVVAESLPRKSPQENRFQIAQPRSQQPSAPCRQPKTTSSTHSIGNRQTIDPSERHRIDDLSPANTETPSQRLPFLRRSSPFDRPRHPSKAASEFLSPPSPLPPPAPTIHQPPAVSRQPSAVRCPRCPRLDDPRDTA